MRRSIEMSGMEKIFKDILCRGYEIPIINKNPLPEYAMKELDYGMIIGTAVTEKGRRFICWVGGGDNPKAFFVLAYSDDNGKSYKEPCLVIDPHTPDLPCDRSTIVGNLWIDPLKRLWLFFNESLGHFDGRCSNWAIRCDDPDAQNLKWSEPEYIWYGMTLNKPTILSSGEWMLPVSLWSRDKIGPDPELKKFYHELDDKRGANVFVSGDQGKTWKFRGGLTFPEPMFDEHMIVELKDGRLWMLARTAWQLMETFSADQGKTWSRPVIARAQSVSSRFFLRRLISGRILLIKHGTEAGKAPPDHSRSMLTAFLSEDEGETWIGGLLLDERNYISYPDGDQTSDGVIHIVYDHCRDELGEILSADIREEDIISKRIVTPGAYLKRLVLRPGKQKKLPTV